MEDYKIIKVCENSSGFKFRCRDENHPGIFISGKLEIQDETLKEISCNCFKDEFLWCPHIVGSLLLILKNPEQITQENVENSVDKPVNMNENNFFLDYFKSKLLAAKDSDSDEQWKTFYWAIDIIKSLFPQKRFTEAFESFEFLPDLLDHFNALHQGREKFHLILSDLYLKMMIDENVDLELKKKHIFKFDSLNFNTANELISTPWDDPILVSLMEGVNETNFDSCKESVFTLAIRARWLKFHLKEKECNNLLQLIVLLESRNLIYSKTKMSSLIEILDPMNHIYSMFIQMKNSSVSGAFHFSDLIKMNKNTINQRNGIPSLVVLSLYALCKELVNETWSKVADCFLKMESENQSMFLLILFIQKTRTIPPIFLVLENANESWLSLCFGLRSLDEYEQNVKICKKIGSYAINKFHAALLESNNTDLIFKYIVEFESFVDPSILASLCSHCAKHLDLKNDMPKFEWIFSKVAGKDPNAQKNFLPLIQKMNIEKMVEFVSNGLETMDMKGILEILHVVYSENCKYLKYHSLFSLDQNDTEKNENYELFLNFMNSTNTELVIDNFWDSTEFFDKFESLVSYQIFRRRFYIGNRYILIF
jgi:hypothetical protein